MLFIKTHIKHSLSTNTTTMMATQTGPRAHIDSDLESIRKAGTCEGPHLPHLGGTSLRGLRL